MLNYKEHNIKEILKTCLTKLANNSHLITDQVFDNLDKFLSNLNVKKLTDRFGEIQKCLGYGVFGSVFELPNNKALKITFDFVEAPFLYTYCLYGKTKGFVNVDEVYKIKFGKAEAFIILRDSLEILSYDDSYQVIHDMKNGEFEKEYVGIQQEVFNALKPMYDLDPDWRGTYSQNIGTQNGKVVLYDGFSKNIRLNPDDIPFLDINI